MDKTLLFATKEIVNTMVMNIYKGSDLATEVMYASNCLEVVFNKKFTEEEEIMVYIELIKIVKKRLHRR